MTRFISRLLRDDSGLETTEVALGIVLFAFVAGFGFFVYGDALADFFGTTGDQINNAAAPATALNNAVGYACNTSAAGVTTCDPAAP